MISLKVLSFDYPNIYTLYGTRFLVYNRADSYLLNLHVSMYIFDRRWTLYSL